jgi:catechol 2,3-dioxygenase-like lactoylglutathione lyase family enzyme
MGLLGLRHVALNVRDPQASKRFYADCFGMSELIL